MREIEVPDLRLQLVAADVRVVRVDARRAKRLDLGERRRGRPRPAVGRSEMENSGVCYSAPAMPVDQELLEILACPVCKEEVKLVPLAEARKVVVRDKFRDKFRGEEPVVEQGLRCVKCGRVYPIVSDIPVMLVEEAFEEQP